LQFILFYNINIFTLFYYSDDMVAIFHTCTRLVEQDIDLKVINKL